MFKLGIYLSALARGKIIYLYQISFMKNGNLTVKEILSFGLNFSQEWIFEKFENEGTLSL